MMWRLPFSEASDWQFYWFYSLPSSLEVWDVREGAPVIGWSIVHHITSWCLVRHWLVQCMVLLHLISISKIFLDTQGCCWWFLDAFRILYLDVLGRTYWKQFEPGLPTPRVETVTCMMDRSCKGLRCDHCDSVIPHINDAFQCFWKGEEGKIQSQNPHFLPFWSIWSERNVTIFSSDSQVMHNRSSTFVDVGYCLGTKCSTPESAEVIVRSAGSDFSRFEWCKSSNHLRVNVGWDMLLVLLFFFFFAVFEQAPLDVRTDQNRCLTVGVKQTLHRT